MVLFESMREVIEEAVVRVRRLRQGDDIVKIYASDIHDPLHVALEIAKVRLKRDYEILAHEFLNQKSTEKLEIATKLYARARSISIDEATDNINDAYLNRVDATANNT